MAWIESHQELRDHRKTLRLARLLDISLPTAIGHLHLLWWWALDNAEDGDLASAGHPADVSRMSMWEGDAQAFWNALIDAGFVDPDGKIHDWYEYAGKLIERRKADAERKRTTRRPTPSLVSAPENVHRTSSGHPPEFRGMSNGRPPDVRRNSTVPRSTTKHTASTDRQDPAPLEPQVCAALSKDALKPWERKRLTEMAAAHPPETVLAAVEWAKEHCRSPNGVLGYAARCIGDAPWDAEPETPSGAPVQRLEDAKRYFARLDREYGGE